jgi:two-component system, NarL family, sensor kinase
LRAIAEALNGASDVDRALRAALSLVIDLLGLRTGWVWLIDPVTGRFYSAAAQDLPPFLRQPVRMTGHTCWCIEAFRSGHLKAGNIDVIECSRLRAALASDRGATQGLRWHASIPLVFGNRQLGIMNVASQTWRKLTRRELDLLTTIASQVGVAIERARLAETSVGAARTEERARLARDLHDTLTQGLTAIALHVEAAMAALPAAGPGVDMARGQLTRALTVTRANLDEARRSLRELRGSPLAGRPLPEVLAALGRQVAADSGIRVHVNASHVPLGPGLPPNIEEALFRIAGEAVTNAQRHAGARDIEVGLTATRTRIRLVVSDNGHGFVVKRRGDGFGLDGMRERARVAGGRVVIRSQPGKGTDVIAEVPLPATARPRRLTRS